MRTERVLPSFINPNLQLDYHGSGKRKDSFRSADKIIKIVKTSLDINSISMLRDRLQYEYTLLKRYMSPYIADTQFVIGSDIAGNPTFIVVQDFIDGISLKEAVMNARQTGLDFSRIEDFFLKSLEMYKDVGELPDYFGKNLTLYNPFASTNVKVTQQQESLHPILVDTDFSWKSQNKIVGPVHKKLMSVGIQRALSSLR